MKITVKVYERDQEIISKIFGEGVYRAGRSEFSDIVLPSDSVSRSHIEIRVTESAVYFTNMSSSGKVRVNGKSLETAELEDGSELLIGPYKIIVMRGEHEAAAAEVPNLEGALAGGEGAGEAAAAVDGEPAAEGVAEIPAEPKSEGQGNDEIVRSLFENQLSKVDNFAPPELPQNEASFPADGPMLQVEGTAALNRAETVVDVKPVVAKLVFTDGPRKGEEMMLETYEVTFGRSKRADIYLDDDKLSRLHAKIARVGMGYRLIDLNSRHGTYVNGVRVLEHPLNSFDTIELGHTKIKFLIHDVIGEVGRGGGALTLERGSLAPVPQEDTKSLHLAPGNDNVMLETHRPGNTADAANNFVNNAPVGEFAGPGAPKKGLSKRTRTLLMVVLGLGLLLWAVSYFQPESKKDLAKDAATTTSTNAPPTPPNATDLHQPPLMSKEFMELSPEMQRSIEGRYNTALRAAEQENFEEAVENLRKIHEVIPYYKQSKEMLDQFSRRLKEKQVQDAAEKAKKDDKQELQMLLEDGVEYLKSGDFDKAAENFNSAITLDPNNPVAIKGLKAAEYKIRDLQQVPPDRDPEKEKVKAVKDLFQKAVEAFSRKSYQEAIDTAEQIRQIELKGDTQYLNEAKQIIDRAHMLQKEEFEPFLTEAKEKYAEGDYNATRDLCEEMVKRNPQYDEAKDLLGKAKKQLERLAKEAYVRGYILESMNRIDEAKQYWNRAKNYVRPGDSYYDKVNKKLDTYQ